MKVPVSGPSRCYKAFFFFIRKMRKHIKIVNCAIIKWKGEIWVEAPGIREIVYFYILNCWIVDTQTLIIDSFIN